MNNHTIRAATSEDLIAIADLFTQSVHQIAANSYSTAQRQSWAPIPPDYTGWQQRLNTLTTLLCEIDNQPAGFIAIKPPSHIELLFTHPNYARKSVASRLYQQAIKLHDSPNLVWTTDASLEAKPFFEQHGWQVTTAETVERNGQHFRRFKMRLMS